MAQNIYDGLANHTNTHRDTVVKPSHFHQWKDRSAFMPGPIILHLGGMRQFPKCPNS